MIVVKNLKKVYPVSKKERKENPHLGKEKIAVNDISFQARPGKIYGLLGPNGAGKTTTLRAIATLIEPTSGTIELAGYQVDKEALEVRRSLSFLTNEIKLDEHFTPHYTMMFFGKMRGMDQEHLESRIKVLSDEFGITAFKDKKIAELSTGMKQKLSIAVSLLHDPPVVIFDEPTIGLDIITAKTVVTYLQALRNEGKTIIISTHIMNVAEKLCDEIGILIDGQLVISGTLQEILQEAQANNLEDAFFSLYEKRGELHG